MKYQDNKIYMTKDPSIFKNLTGNRDTTHWKTVYNSIKKNGYLLNPIMVNENFEIIDGQGRTLALKELGLPHYYYIVPGTKIDECRILNANQKNWSVKDYIESYAQAGGSIDYVWLKKAIKDYAALGLDIQTIVTVLRGGGINVKNAFDEIRTGKYKIKDYSEGIKTLDYFSTIRPYLTGERGGGSSRLFLIIYSLLKYGLVDEKRLAAQIEKYPYPIKTFTLATDNLEMLQEIYNYHRKKTDYFKEDYLRLGRKLKKEGKE